MRTPIRSLCAIIAIGMLVAACGGGNTASSSGGSATSAGLPADLIAAAKKEGKLVMVTSTNIQAADGKIFEEFGKIFGLEIVSTSGSSAEVNSRILAERSQGVHSVDVSVVGETGQRNFIEGKAFTPLQPLLVIPDINDRSLWYLDQFPWLPSDVEKKYVSDYLIRIDPNLTRTFYNSKKVTQQDLDGLQSWLDFIDNPRWKGKLVVPGIADPNADGAAQGLTLMWKFLGQDWFDQLFRKNPPAVVGPNQSRQIVDGLARGQWEVCIFCDLITSNAASAQQDGLPVAQLNKTLKEGPAVDTTGHFAVFDQAPHPNAAKLFVNWILTKEGQTKVNELLDPAAASGSLAMRKDVPQGNQPDDLWNDVHNFKLEFLSAEEHNQAQDEVKAYIPKLLRELGIVQ
jgi:iron(III) transport system substrate-binding protein